MEEDIDPHALSPMYDNKGSHFYIDEISRLKNGSFVIPVRWLEDEDRNVYADAYAIKFDHNVRNCKKVNVFVLKC